MKNFKISLAILALLSATSAVLATKGALPTLSEENIAEGGGNTPLPLPLPTLTHEDEEETAVKVPLAYDLLSDKPSEEQLEQARQKMDEEAFAHGLAQMTCTPQAPAGFTSRAEQLEQLGIKILLPKPFYVPFRQLATHQRFQPTREAFNSDLTKCTLHEGLLESEDQGRAVHTVLITDPEHVNEDTAASTVGCPFAVLRASIMPVPGTNAVCIQDPLCMPGYKNKRLALLTVLDYFSQQEKAVLASFRLTRFGDLNSIDQNPHENLPENFTELLFKSVGFSEATGLEFRDAIPSQLKEGRRLFLFNQHDRAVFPHVMRRLPSLAATNEGR